MKPQLITNIELLTMMIFNNTTTTTYFNTCYLSAIHQTKVEGVVSVCLTMLPPKGPKKVQLVPRLLLYNNNKSQRVIRRVQSCDPGVTTVGVLLFLALVFLWKHCCKHRRGCLKQHRCLGLSQVKHRRRVCFADVLVKETFQVERYSKAWSAEEGKTFRFLDQMMEDFYNSPQLMRYQAVRVARKAQGRFKIKDVDRYQTSGLGSIVRNDTHLESSEYWRVNLLFLLTEQRFNYFWSVVNDKGLVWIKRGGRWVVEETEQEEFPVEVAEEEFPVEDADEDVVGDVVHDAPSGEKAEPAEDGGSTWVGGRRRSSRLKAKKTTTAAVSVGGRRRSSRLQAKETATAPVAATSPPTQSPARQQQPKGSIIVNGLRRSARCQQRKS
jgi:hypothetical protein